MVASDPVLLTFESKFITKLFQFVDVVLAVEVDVEVGVVVEVDVEIGVDVEVEIGVVVVIVVEVVIVVLIGVSEDSASSQNWLKRSSNVFSMIGSFSFLKLILYSDACPFSSWFVRTDPLILVISS